MTQGYLFPIKVKHHQPPRGRGKDLRLEAIGEDGMEWALKRQAEHPLLPVTEYLCYQLAQTCALATPHCAILTDLDGAQVFGSRIEGGLVEMARLPQAEVIQKIKSCAGRISACYALDLVIGNEDRHFGNFLFRERSDGNVASVVIDYSRAWWINGWPPMKICSHHCQTTTHISILRSMGCWSAPDALLTLGTISTIPYTAIDDWLNVVPAQWLPAAERAALELWWRSEAFHASISECVTYCK